MSWINGLNVYIHCLWILDMDPLVIVAGASVIGAGLNTLRGYLHSEEPYSARKLAGSVIIAGFAGLALASSIAFEGLSQEAMVVVGLVTGFTADYAITKAKKD